MGKIPSREMAGQRPGGEKELDVLRDEKDGWVGRDLTGWRAEKAEAGLLEASHTMAWHHISVLF